jgi:predicted transcriptional regulator
MRSVKINSIAIKPLITHTTNPDDVLGGKMFIDPYSNCGIIAKKKSGKTTILYHILKKVCRGGNYPTNVIMFCSTIHKDDTYKLILEMLKKKGCNVTTHTHFIDNGENIIDGLLDELGRESKDEKEEKPVKTKLLKFEGDEEEDKKPPAKPKKISAEYVLVFDDLGSDARHKSLTQLCKVLRHYKMRTFFLQQNLYDLDAPCRKQLDYLLLFRNFNEEKLKNIYESVDLSIPFEQFQEIYNYATKEPYHFLYIDVRNEEFRENFDKMIIYE